MSSFGEYLKSSVITFVATFAAAVLPGIGDVQFSKGAIIALILVGIRAGVKAIFEMLAVVNATPIITDADLSS